MRLTKLTVFGFSILGIVLAFTFISTQLSKYALDVSLSDWGKGYHGYEVAINEQLESGKPVVVFFYTEWCGSCKELRRQVLAKSDVSAYFINVHPVQINPEAGLLESKLADRFNVAGYPSLFVVDEINERGVQVRGLFNISVQEFIDKMDWAIQVVYRAN